MRKNRKMTRKHSVVTAHFVHTVAILMMSFVMVLLNFVASSRCRQMEKDCGRKEALLKKLDDDLQRETAHWEVMKTSEGLEAALRKHGLSMHYPNASQNVHMRKDGTPVPGQLSLAKVAQRACGVATANYRMPTAKRRR